jgi:parallel beta helix pectate lyase-like protein
LTVVLWCVSEMAVAATLQVGPTRPFQAPCAAIAAAAPGDIIEIDAGLYLGDVCAWHTDNLTIRGVNGWARLDAKSKNAQGKGIWVPYGRDTVIENIEFFGAKVPDKNGAGIRASGVNLTVRNCYFHDNEEGILESNIAGSNILIEFTEFDNNGYRDGQSHNVYIGHVASLIFRYNYSHNSVTGHLLKTRAAVNYILYNRLTGEDGTGSYEVDVPNGGTTYVIGNLIQQGPNTENSTLLTYLEEGINASNPGTDLYVVNNTFVNQRPAGGTFVYVRPAGPTPPVLVNNIFYGPGTVTNRSDALATTNFIGDPLFVDVNNFDYHLALGSPAIDAGSAPGSANDYPLKPFDEYLHPACGEQRIPVGGIDIGAYEYGGAGNALTCL